MRTWEDPAPVRARIEIIPMIDVMMFLLVFFVLISINVIPAAGLKTRLPTSTTAQDNRDTHNAIITVAKSGTLQLDGKEVPIAELSQQLRALKQSKAQVNVIVKGDAEVELQRLVDVMDAVKGGGIEALSIAAKRTPAP
ncbi:MAG: biopolymer transporter ExbD [Rhodocyclaceae bacterium]|nr:MAG: biopolymer transporter ExbD [Rhodocyclaceae bacterium]